MKTSLLSKRFVELKQQWETIEEAKEYRHDPIAGKGFVVNEIDLLNWEIKALNLMMMACRKDSVHVDRFEKLQQPVAFRSEYGKLQQLGAIFDAAREDFDGGYLNSVRTLVQAEVFDSELEQAKELLSANYRIAAAVIAGVVLETNLRQLCVDRDLGVGKLDKMNSDLARAGCYTLQVQKRVTALADIRNSAAHGHIDKFSDEDVSDMIAYVERFLSDHLLA